jgi:multiple antibiotic resistance protein
MYRRIRTALSISESPLAMPILAGSGTIATAMNFSAGGFVNRGVTIAVFAILCAITYLCFVFGE